MTDQTDDHDDNTLTVGALRAAIAGLPDDALVVHDDVERNGKRRMTVYGVRRENVKVAPGRWGPTYRYDGKDGVGVPALVIS